MKNFNSTTADTALSTIKRYNTMKIFESRDFYLCGMLILKGFNLVDHDRKNGYTIFTFEETPELKKTISQYYRSECSVDPAAYGMMLRQLKGVMHNSVSTNNHENNNNEGIQ